MSTSCIFALYDADGKDIILLEKTHDGFEDVVKHHIAEIENRDVWDIEEIANYFVKKFDYDIAVYSHKYPHYAYVYVCKEGVEYKLLKVEIDCHIVKLIDCLPDIQKALKEKEKIAVIGELK